MSTLPERLTAAAAAAIRDIEPAIVAAGPRLSTLTVEVELSSKGQIVGAVAWTQLRVDLTKVLGLRG